MERLRDADFTIEAHDDHFPQNTKDPEWIAEITRRGWIAFTKDKEIARDEREIDALMISGGRVYLPAGKMKQPEFAELVVRSKVQLLRHIKQQKKRKSGAYMAKIRPDPKSPYKPGKIETWVDREKWNEKVKKRTRK